MGDSERASGKSVRLTMRLVKILLGGLAALLGLGATAVLALVFLVDLDGLIDRYTAPALDAASAALGRELKVDEVHVTWFPVLGVEATTLAVAESPAVEGNIPFLQAEAMSIGVELWPALSSFGKDLRVDRVVLSRPVVRVVRMEDGRYNFSDLGAGGEADPSMKAEEDQIADYVESAHAARIAIEDGELVYLAPGQEELRVKQVDFEVLDIELGQPTRLNLALALFAETQNLRVEMETGPLPSKLSSFELPAIKSAELFASDFPLGRLGVLDEASGLDIGQALMNADVVVKPSATGIRIEGPIDLRGLRIASGQKTGQAFDAGVTLALATGYDFAELRFDPTELRLGPARLRAQGLVRTATLSWAELEVDTLAPFAPGALLALVPGGGPDPGGEVQFNLTSNGSPESVNAQGKIVATGLDYDAGGTRIRGPVSMNYRLSGTPADLSFDLGVAADGAKFSGGGLEKKSGTKLRVDVQGKANGSALRASQLAIEAGASRVTGSAYYPLSGGKMRLAFDTGRLSLVSLRTDMGLDLGAMAENAFLSAKGSFEAPVSDPSKGQIQVPSFDYEAGKNRIRGSARVGRFDPLEGELAASSSLLDADALLGSSSSGGASSGPSNEPILPSSMRRARFAVKGSFKRLVYDGVSMQNADLSALLEDGKLKIRRFDFDAYGGSLDADGTVLDLTAIPMKYELKARLKSMNAGQLLSKWTSLGSTLSGKLDTRMELSGSGLEWTQMARTLAGGVSAEFSNGSFSGLNVLEETLTPLSKAVNFVSPGSVDLGRRLSTDFRRLAGEFELKQGQLQLARKMRLETSAGLVELGGGIGLDKKLNLKGDLMLTPDMIRRLTGGRVKVNETIPMGFGVGCSMTKPCIRNVDVKGVAGQLTAALAKDAAQQAASRATREIEKRLPDQTKETVDKAKEKAKKSLKNIFGR
ncbi:MAG: AsmA family protein [Myxococcota bacterium]